MSSNTQRRFIHAKRRNGEPSGALAPPPCRHNDSEDIETKRGIKRQLGTPKKNIANDRLKRLRTKLSEDVVKVVKPCQSFLKSSADFQTRKQCSAPKRSSAAVVVDDLKVKQAKVVANRAPVSLKSPPQSTTVAAQKPSCASSVLDNFTFTTSKVFQAQQSSISPALQNQVNESNLVTEDMEWDSCSDELRPTPPPKSDDNHLYIVVDTNIFMSHLSLIKDIVEKDNNDENRPIIYIPWMVNEELDYLKDDKVMGSSKHQSQAAVKYINYALVNHNGRIIGQTLDEFNEQKSCDKSPDNKILMCALQLSEKHKNIVLLSNDVNIRNKAMIHGIRAYSHGQFMSAIFPKAKPSSKAQKILDSFTDLCSKVITCCVKEAYGENWNKLHLLGSKPQSIEDCIKIFRKYWVAVFQEHLLKQFNQAIDHLSAFLSKNKNSLKDNSTQLGDLVRHCVRVCVYLKDVKEHKKDVEETIRAINEIKESQ